MTTYPLNITLAATLIFLRPDALAAQTTVALEPAVMHNGLAAATVATTGTTSVARNPVPSPGAAATGSPTVLGTFQLGGATMAGWALALAGHVAVEADTLSIPAVVSPPGSVAAWGNNAYGQSAAPAGLGGVTAISASLYHTVALQSDGAVVAWGDNSSGQSTVPGNLGGVTAVAAGGNHTLALKTDGTLVAWGDNTYGEILVPSGLSGVTAIAAGLHHSVALLGNGTVVAWGDNSYGQTTVPDGLTGVKAVAAGDGHTLALLSNGTVVAWGANNFFHQATVPAGLSGVTAVAAGGSHSVALQSDGTVVAWGGNLLGQATVSAGLGGVIAIAAGEDHTVALKSDGTVVAWGWDANGQTDIPVNMGGVTAIAAGWNHTVALIGPIIAAQPLAQTFASGGSVALCVVAVGSGLGYQWQFNGGNILGATSPTLNLANLSAANAGAYRVVVTDTAGGSITSQDAILQLLFFGNLRFYAGMTLEGTVGRQFRVDYADAVNLVATNWLMLTNITLPSSPLLVIDPTHQVRASASIEPCPCRNHTCPVLRCLRVFAGLPFATVTLAGRQSLRTPDPAP